MNVGIYKTPKFTAYLYPTKIIICTSMQCITMRSDRYNESLVDDYKLAIIRGDIESISDLKTYDGRLRWFDCQRP